MQKQYYKCFEVDDGSTGYWEVYYSDGVADAYSVFAGVPDLHYMSVIELEDLGDWISAVRERTAFDVKIVLNHSNMESWEGAKI